MKTKKSAPFFFVEFFFMNLGYFVSLCKISRDFTDILIRKKRNKVAKCHFPPFSGAVEFFMAEVEDKQRRKPYSEHRSS